MSCPTCQRPIAECVGDVDDAIDNHVWLCRYSRREEVRRLRKELCEARAEISRLREVASLRAENDQLRTELARTRPG